MKIEKKLIEWEEKGLITTDQHGTILDYEKSLIKTNRFIYTFVTLGIVTISIGIISLIASNWEEIPDFIKIISDLLILILTGFAINKYSNSDQIVIRDRIINLFILLILASIGLISQVYNTGGKFYQAIALWCIITLPLVLISFSKFSSYLWILFFINSYISYISETYFSGLQYNEILLNLNSLLPQFLITIGVILIRFKDSALERFGQSSLKMGIIGLVMSTISIHFLTKFEIINFTHYFYFLINITMLAIIMIIQKEVLLKIKISYSILTLIILLFIYSRISGKSGDIENAVFFIMIYFFISILFHLLGYPKLFELGITIIGLRFLLIYFEIFSTLLLTGFGLIISGSLIIFLSIIYLKYKERIFEGIRKYI